MLRTKEAIVGKEKVREDAVGVLRDVRKLL
jgi:hypothetical protein